MAQVVDPAHGQQQLEDLDEVTVKGERLMDLRAAIVKAEDAFYAQYNELNERDEFDITCNEVARTGTKLAKRACYPKAVYTALDDEAIAIWYAMFMGSDVGIARPQVTPPNVVLAAKVQDYKKNMLKVLRRNPKLRALANDAEELQRKYDLARKDRLKGRLALTE